MTPSYILGLTRAAFRQESEELLSELDSALLALEAEPGDGGALNRTFRAMHTLKGSGATAGYRDVAALLHDVEDIFNDARDGRARVTPTLIDLSLRISDVVRRLLGAGDGETTAILREGQGIVAELKAGMASAPPVGAASPTHAVPAPEDGDAVWAISFTPSPRMFFGGNDPLVMLREVLGHGVGRVRARLTAPVELDTLDPELCHLSWEVQIVSSASEGALLDAFAFVLDEAEVRAERIDPAGAWVLPAAAYFEATMARDFEDECDEDLADIEAHLLALERDPQDRERFDGLRRTLHNLKGLGRLLLSGARAVPPARHPLRALSELCHAAEGFLGERLAGPSARDLDAVIPVMLETVDRLKCLLRAFRDAGEGEWPDDLLSRLGVVPAGAPDAAAGDDPGARGGMVRAVAKQCDDLVAAVAERCSAGDAVGDDDRRALARALDTLRRAAGYDRCGELVDRTRSLSKRCDDASGEGVAKSLSWDEFQTAYDEVRACVRRAAEVSARPAPRRTTAPPEGRAISIRASKGPGAEPRAGTGGAGPGVAAVARTVRVDQDKLDRLMRAIGELLVAKNSLPVLARRLDDAARGSGKEVKETGDRIAHIADDLQDAMRQIRMTPIKTVFQRFPRMIRDLARSQGKEIQLIINGEETELDKTVLEQLGDPLVHLVRNSADHGIEPPEERVAAGKPEVGTVGLEVLKEGSNVLIRISDDGRGMDPARLRRKAVERALLTPEEAAAMSDQRALELIFLPGFSTAERVTSISGRGVGMDVVQSNIRRLRGSVSLASELGQGSTISIRLPSTLMVSKGILVQCATEQYVLPIESVREMVRLPRAGLRFFRAAPFASVRGSIVPVYSLTELLGLGDGDGAARPLAQPEMNAALVSTSAGQVALVVDRFIAEMDVIVKPLTQGLERLLMFQGATILGDGRVALIVDPARLDALISQQYAPADAPADARATA